MRVREAALPLLLLSIAACDLRALGTERGAEREAPAERAEPGAEAPAAPAAPAPSGAAVTTPDAPIPGTPTLDVASLVERVRPAVVTITVKQGAGQNASRPPRLPDFFGPELPFGPDRPAPERQGLGSGFIVDPEGYVATNAHVVEDASEVRVRLADEREFEAKVVGRDPKLDVALLKIDGAKDLPAVQLGSSESLRVGETVIAVGNPFGLGHTVTTGIVSAKARSLGLGPYDDFIQTDASINPGNSGGPLFNPRGEVVGMNTAIRAGANGIGFAIPVDALREVLPQLKEKGRVERGKLGLRFQPVTRELAEAIGLEEAKGALVSEVEPGSAAAKVGIRVGDVLLAVSGEAIRHAEDLPRLVARNAPGTELPLTILRDGKKLELRPKLDALDPAPKAEAARPGAGGAAELGAMGLWLSDAEGGGARVERVADGADVGSLQPGDVVVEAGGKKIPGASALKAVLEAAPKNKPLLLRVRRGDGTLFVALPVPGK